MRMHQVFSLLLSFALSLSLANGAALDASKRQAQTTLNIQTLPATPVATSALLIDTSVPKNPAPTPANEGPAEQFKMFKGQNRQVMLLNRNWTTWRDSVPNRDAKAERYKIRNAMVHARNFYWAEAASFAEPDAPFISDAPSGDLTVFQQAANDAENYCYAQANSAVEVINKDPVMFCYLGYTIRLSTTRNETMRVKCLEAAKIASQLAQYVIDDSQTAYGSLPPFPGMTWEMVGTSFWSEDPSWVVYIGNEAGSTCDPSDSWPIWPAKKAP
ncbi:hypothetical protein Dda_2040 [Drechslerella dactyloides]|uniref:Uncharacterized protein n=1 Tax=Drechslerella dactyloides TaxID=74499 RepID=A0AAD6J6Z8_DREDA|nr:hypothetical protein Dda_2040 [Drechslerella dactyloides]